MPSWRGKLRPREGIARARPQRYLSLRKRTD